MFHRVKRGLSFSSAESIGIDPNLESAKGKFEKFQEDLKQIERLYLDHVSQLKASSQAQLKVSEGFLSLFQPGSSLYLACTESHSLHAEFAVEGTEKAAEQLNAGLKKIEDCKDLCKAIEAEIEDHNEVGAELAYYTQKVEGLQAARLKTLNKGKEEKPKDQERRIRNEQKAEKLKLKHAELNGTLVQQLTYLNRHRDQYFLPIFQAFHAGSGGFHHLGSHTCNQVSTFIRNNDMHSVPWSQLLTMSPFDESKMNVSSSGHLAPPTSSSQFSSQSEGTVSSSSSSSHGQAIGLSPPFDPPSSSSSHANTNDPFGADPFDNPFADRISNTAQPGASSSSSSSSLSAPAGRGPSHNRRRSSGGPPPKGPPPKGPPPSGKTPGGPPPKRERGPSRGPPPSGPPPTTSSPFTSTSTQHGDLAPPPRLSLSGSLPNAHRSSISSSSPPSSSAIAATSWQPAAPDTSGFATEPGAPVSIVDNDPSTHAPSRSRGPSLSTRTRQGSEIFIG